MKKLSAATFIFFSCHLLCAQDGKILKKDLLTFPNSVYTILKIRDTAFNSIFKNVDFYKISYLSDGLKVTGYIAEPKARGKYPCIIANRGGNRSFSQWAPMSIVTSLGIMANWGYVVIASQYRGNDGGEGKEEFGGKDVNDVLNLVPALSQLANADTSRIGMQGISRGGMMTYLILKQSCRFKAASITAGAANIFANLASRPDMESNVFEQLIPNYVQNKQQELTARSAVFWADKLCKTTPILLMQGSADWRVLPTESLEVVQKLYQAKHPLRFILYEGADHGIREFSKESFAETKRHFDYYVRDGKKWPNMEPHGQ